MILLATVVLPDALPPQIPVNIDCDTITDPHNWIKPCAYRWRKVQRAGLKNCTKGVVQQCRKSFAHASKWSPVENTWLQPVCDETRAWGFTWVVVAAVFAAALWDRVLCLLVLGDLGEPAEGGLGGSCGETGCSGFLAVPFVAGSEEQSPAKSSLQSMAESNVFQSSPPLSGQQTCIILVKSTTTNSIQETTWTVWTPVQ